MRRAVWLFGWIGVAVWSLFCAALYGVVNVVGGWFARNADMVSSDPQVVEWTWRVMSVVHSLSTSVVLVGWGLVSLLILAVPWLLDRLAGPDARFVAAARVGRGPSRAEDPSPPSRKGDVIDLAPDDYTVRPAPVPPGQSGSPGPQRFQR